MMAYHSGIETFKYSGSIGRAGISESIQQLAMGWMAVWSEFKSQ
jgi:hypothetical protein